MTETTKPTVAEQMPGIKFREYDQYQIRVNANEQNITLQQLLDALYEICGNCPAVAVCAPKSFQGLRVSAAYRVVGRNAEDLQLRGGKVTDPVCQYHGITTPSEYRMPR